MATKTDKSPRKRGTVKQQKLAKALIENLQSDAPITAGQMLENVGYAKSVAEAKPTEIIESEGVKTELEILGFSEDKAKHVVASIMNSDEEESKDRLKAAEKVFKVFGSFKEGAPTTIQTINHNLFYKPEFQDAMRAAEAQMKNLIIHAKPIEENNSTQ